MGCKKNIAVLLILVFSVSFLPISQVGNLLSSNQLQEEVIHSPLGKEVTSQENDLIHHLVILSEISARQQRPWLNEMVNSRQADDISTPPPNA